MFENRLSRIIFGRILNPKLVKLQQKNGVALEITLYVTGTKDSSLHRPPIILNFSHRT